MRRIIAVFTLCLFLCACGESDKALQRPLLLRERILKANTCSFETKITADYADVIYTFSLSCVVDTTGALHFTVLEPESISGIEGTISSDGAALSFDDTVLAFPTLADGQITPVTAPWVFYNALRSGYIAACGKEGPLLKVNLDDSYEENPIRLDMWMNENNIPTHSEILYKGKRILSMQITSFQIV